MTLASIFKTVVHIYCSSIVMSAISSVPVEPQHRAESSTSLPILVAAYAEMAPVAPPEDRGSGR